MNSTTNINKNILEYRQCVGVALFNQQGKVFVGERIDTPGAWQMPQGGVDDGETPEQTAIRELKEEIGTDKATLIKVAPRKVTYDLPNDLIAKLWNGKYRGQEQTWLAYKFNGSDSDINLNAHTPAEFKRYQWVELEHTHELIVPFKKDIYKQVVNFFKDIR